MDITVVVPLYNKRLTVLRAIESIQKQKYPPKEILIINDGSTDGSDELVRSMNDDRIRMIDQQNAGVSAARNTGVFNAIHEWIAFLDADDEWYPGFLEKIEDMHRRWPEHDMYATTYYSGDYMGGLGDNKCNGILFDGDDGVMINYFKIAALSAPPICSSAVCIRKKRLQEISGFPVGIKAGEDLITWARLAIENPPVYSRLPLAVFWKEKAHTYDDVPKRYPDVENKVGKMLTSLRNDRKECSEDLDLYIAHWYKMRASIYLRLGKRMRALREAMRSLSYDKSNMRVYAYVVMCAMPGKAINYAFRKLSNK